MNINQALAEYGRRGTVITFLRPNVYGVGYNMAVPHAVVSFAGDQLFLEGLGVWKKWFPSNEFSIKDLDKGVKVGLVQIANIDCSKLND